MITLTKHKSRICPAIYCDVCGKRITDAENAVCLWNHGKENEYVIVHKNTCDPSNLKYECSMILSHFIIYLMTNVGMNPENFDDLKRIIDKAKFLEFL